MSNSETTQKIIAQKRARLQKLQAEVDTIKAEIDVLSDASCHIILDDKQALIRETQKFISILHDIDIFATKNKKILGSYELDYPPFSDFKTVRMELEILRESLEIVKDIDSFRILEDEMSELKKRLIYILKNGFDRHNLGPAQIDIINGVYKKLCHALGIRIIKVEPNERYDDDKMQREGGEAGSGRLNAFVIEEVIAYGLCDKQGNYLQKPKVRVYRH